MVDWGWFQLLDKRVDVILSSGTCCEGVVTGPPVNDRPLCLTDKDGHRTFVDDDSVVAVVVYNIAGDD